MKKRILLVTAIGAMAYVTLTSNDNGPTSNYTGSKGAAAGCGPSGCHTSGAVTAVSIAITLDSAGTLVTKYSPGKTYTIKLTATNGTSSTLPKHGFQLSVVKGSGSSATQAGTFGAAPTGTEFLASSGLSIWQHGTPLSPISGTGASGTIYRDSISWTAPVAGSGTVSIYAAVNAVNANGNSLGDSWNTANASFLERTSSASVGTITSSSTINAYPNPVAGTLNLQFSNSTYGNYAIAVYDLAGRQIAAQTADINGASASISLDASNWAPGLYNAVVENNGTRQVVQVVKQ